MNSHPIAALARTLLLLACLMATTAQAAVPFWGARQSSPVDTPLTMLKPGEWIWGGDNKDMGPMVMVVSLTEQRAYAYRNGLLVGASTVSTGKPGHETPTGVFTILEKDKDHHSKTYNNAPMPYEERLTWDGIALHAGGLPGFPESHGCVHLPSAFAATLFDSTSMGMTVVIAREGHSPVTVAHPGILSPVDPGTGQDTRIPQLDDGTQYRWTPEHAKEGPISLVLSRSDQRMVVLRGGIEIGRARVLVHEPKKTAGTHAYVMGSGHMPGTFPQFPDGQAPLWHAFALPGHDGESDTALDSDAINRVIIPAGFIKAVYPLLRPGTVLIATDARILSDTTGGKSLQIVDAKPPES